MEWFFRNIGEMFAKMPTSLTFDVMLYIGLAALAALHLGYIVAHFVAASRKVKAAGSGCGKGSHAKRTPIGLNFGTVVITALMLLLAGFYFVGHIFYACLYFGIYLLALAVLRALHDILQRAASKKVCAAHRAARAAAEEQARPAQSAPETKPADTDERQLTVPPVPESTPVEQPVHEMTAEEIMASIRKLNGEPAPAPMTEEEVLSSLKDFDADYENEETEEAEGASEQDVADLYAVLGDKDFDFEDMDEELEETEEEAEPEEEEAEEEPSEEAEIEETEQAAEIEEEEEAEEPFVEEAAEETEETEETEKDDRPEENEESERAEETEEIEEELAEEPEEAEEPAAEAEPAPAEQPPAEEPPAAEEEEPAEEPEPPAAEQAAAEEAAPVTVSGPCEVLTDLPEEDESAESDEKILAEIERLSNRPEEEQIVREARAAVRRQPAAKARPLTANELIDKANAAKLDATGSEESMRTMQQVALLLQKEREKKKRKTPEEQRRMNEALADLLRAIGKKGE